MSLLRKDLITWHESSFSPKIGSYALTSRRPGYGSWRSVSQQAGCDHVSISQGHRCNVCGVTTIETSGQRTSSIAIGNTARRNRSSRSCFSAAANFRPRSFGM